MEPLETVDLSIVIVNWNVCDLLQRCLVSIFGAAVPQDKTGVWCLRSGSLRNYRFEVIVVDSASWDGSVQMVRERFPSVCLYPSEMNIGYTGGNNLGICQSQGRYVLLLNPDTEILDDALGTMVAYMDQHPDIGVLGPQLLWPDGSVQSSRRRFPTLCTALVESTFLQKWFPDHPVLRRYYILDRPDDVIDEVDWVSGSCLLVRRTVIDQVGMLDDAYFMYSEELDWQKRIRDRGWQVIYLPTAQIVHHEGKSSGQVKALTHIRFSRSKIRYFRLHHGALVGGMVHAWLLVNYVYEWIVEALKWCVGHKRALRLDRMRVYGKVLSSRFRG